MMYNKEKTELTVADNVYFPTIASAVNYVFGTDYATNDKIFFGGHFIPQIFHSIGLQDYYLWFPLALNVKMNNKYFNRLCVDGTQVIEGLTNGQQWFPPTDYKRIAFYCELINNSRNYRFIGVFKFDGMENGCRKWKRTADRVKIYQQNKYEDLIINSVSSITSIEADDEQGDTFKIINQQFTHLLKNHADLLMDRKKFAGLLRDILPGMTLQTNLLLNLFDINIHIEIKKTRQINNNFVYRFVKRLCDDYGVSKRNASWAVATWCYCYGEAVLGKVIEIIPDIVVNSNDNEKITDTGFMPF